MEARKNQENSNDFEQHSSIGKLSHIENSEHKNSVSSKEEAEDVQEDQKKVVNTDNAFSDTAAWIREKE